MVTLKRHFTFICTLRLWLLLTANVCAISRKLNVIIVDIIIVLQSFSLDVNIFLTLTIYQVKTGFSFLISGSWADF
jgi:hypothetical protein